MTISPAEPAVVDAAAATPLLNNLTQFAEHEPIRSELFGVDHLEAHARALASSIQLAEPRRAGKPLLPHFHQIGRELEEAHARIVAVAQGEETISPDAEWLIDNFYIVADALREVRQDMPRGYYQELPKVSSGPFDGLPRVYALAVELIAHTDSSPDETNVTRFAQAFQEVTPLTIGELWAVPIMLRLSLLENLRRLARQMLVAREHRQEADGWKERLLTLCARERDAAAERLAAPDHQPHCRWSDAFVVHLLQLLRDHGPDAAFGIECLERFLGRKGTQPTEVLRREHQRQASNQVSVGNCVTSLRLLSALDWTAFFEHTSQVESELRTDPAGAYLRQDFATRDRYRRAVERLARGSGQNELEVARRVVNLARQAARQHGLSENGSIANRTRDRAALLPVGLDRPPQTHVGYYLVGPGSEALAKSLRYRPRWGDAYRAGVLRQARLLYFSSLIGLTGLMLAGLAAYAAEAGADAWLIVLVFAAALLPASDLAVGLLHYLVTLLLPPRVLQKLDFREGIPPDCATFVVMPSMLLRAESAATLAEHLEIHYLSNPDPNLYFALLTDFADAQAESMPEDAALIQEALVRIKTLNERYCAGGPDRFFLFHRKRLWNPVQNCWMGWERKRGKLAEFNRLLRGARETSFTTHSSDTHALPQIRFVITLDADTQLPRETAARLIGTLAHPLNRPQFDAERGRVVQGYGILQPRVSLGLSSTRRSLFSRIFANSAGLDPYTTAVSDVYMDLFGLGTFTGKGIYDVDAFEAATGATFPENHILSHDLIEGNYARCGLVTDVELLDDFPPRYHAYARREHRWVRGDWQLLPWLFARPPVQADRQTFAHASGSDRERLPTHRSGALPTVERWKILDNLRRSLVPPGLVLLLVLGWTVLPGSPWVWTLFALLIPGMPFLLLMAGAVVAMFRDREWRLHWLGVRGSLRATGGQVMLTISFLGDQARLMLDAIFRTLTRLLITRRHLLEWETAANTERRLGGGFRQFCQTMGLSSGVAVLFLVLVARVHPGALPAAVPLLLAWFLAPGIAYVVSRPPTQRLDPLTTEDARAMHRLARRTWSFFEAFVTAEDSYLPPDNYQEDPKNAIAHRTSPTNMGLYLTSCLAAHDFGYLSLPALLDRLELTFATLERMERRNGHFYNWYDTRSLQPLPPLYISTVDSGNFLALLIALKQGLREKTEEPIPSPAALAGLRDTALLVQDARATLQPPLMPEPLAVFRKLDSALTHILAQLEQPPADLLGWDDLLKTLGKNAEELTAGVQQLASQLQEEPEELRDWSERFAALVQERRTELTELAPWLPVMHRAGAGETPGAAAVREQLLSPASAAEMRLRIDHLAGVLTDQGQPATPGLADLRTAVQQSSAPELVARGQNLADRANALAAAMDFRLLYNETRHLFSIGLNLSANRLDPAHYDLLASESALTSFLAIARGDAPRRHWFHLGRPLTRVPDGIALVSWGGTMFEYLMPRLLFPNYPGTLLDASCQGAVDRQIEYGGQNRVPWGISESGFNALDTGLDYQYQSFGVPGLGLKRGLAKDLVIAPYATALALMIRPHRAAANFRALAAEGAAGRYGFHEALDYSHERGRERRRPAVVRSYMAHHQGMSLVALANCLLGNPMPRRFHNEPMVRATELLLQERLPLMAPFVEAHGDEAAAPPMVREHLLPMSRHLTTPETPFPRTHLLSTHHYSVMLTNAGSGYSTCRGLDVTRWREDRTRDDWGQYCYVRDLRSGLLWSTGYQPTRRQPDQYLVVYSTDKAEFRRQDAGIETHWEITVSPENCAEVRRVTLTNLNPQPHEVELTSYAEVVLSHHGADLAHPAFGKLFLETEFLPGAAALLCRRRPRSSEQKPVWGVHVLAVEGQPLGEVQYETDRMRFLGRGRTAANPAALDPGTVLSGTTGPVLDPVFSLRCRVRVPAGGSVNLAFTTAVAESREEALALADQYHDFHGVMRAFELAWAHSQVELRHLHLSAEEAHLYQRLAAHVVFAGRSLRSAAAVTANRVGQSALWRHGISGDLPIVVAHIREADEIGLARQLLLAHAYWRLKGLTVDLVLLNDHPAGYLEELQQQLLNLARSSDSHALLDRPGGVFVRQAAHLSREDRLLLEASARVVLHADQGSLASQVDRPEPPLDLPALLTTLERPRSLENNNGVLPSRTAPDLVFFNGVGGFSPDGREYVIHTGSRPGEVENQAARRPLSARAGSSAVRPTPALPPAPWINVIANPHFGFLVTETGSGYTWAGNSQQNRLTPWSNDPVSDPSGEIVYLRDEVTGEAWTPTPLPLGSGPVAVHHGQGYTRFQGHAHGLDQELLLLVAPGDPVKLISLTVRNTGTQLRHLSATFYAEWVLGTLRDLAPLHVVVSLDAESGALLACNAFAGDFAGRVAFADVNLRPRSFTTSRTEFLGRNGFPAAPAALGRVGLSNQELPLADPCAAIFAPFDLQPGEQKEIVFFLGQAESVSAARTLLARYRQPGSVAAALKASEANWERILGAVQVSTPDRALDLLLNRWLLYQVLSCRVWGRSAFYQSGGAYGFRDQLQDVMALVYGAPEEARAQLLRAAARQFLEGDVQHWWHPPGGRGVRTRFSDDFLWLPFVACQYVTVTGDDSVLDELVPFLRAALLKPEEEEVYGLPDETTETATLYEHCLRAIDNGCRFGRHGLPLMGTGDWNDGMNRVGVGGQGESVWDGWFLLTILRRFADVAQRRGDTQRAEECRARAERLRGAIEENAWDGRWYRRAYFDDGTPLGSAENDACRIDSIAQTWAVFSGAANPERARQAMAAVEEFLVRDADQLVLLFTPPFDTGPLQPGYIKGYVPGIRENGGQYTHAATWVVQAVADLGQGKRAVELFDLLNPIHHAETPEQVARYRVEPYVVAADIYGQPPHVGRGGWTWYTGSASWLYRVALEGILGFHVVGNTLRLDPRIAPTWPGFQITYRHGTAIYRITVTNPHGAEQGVKRLTVDGRAVEGNTIELANDGQTHEVQAEMGEK